MQPLHNRAIPRVICLAIFLAAFCWPLHAGQLVTLNIDQVSYTATFSGNVPCTEYGHVTVSVSQDPGVVQYLQVSASFNGSPPAWLVRNFAVPDFISNASTTVDLTQLGVMRGTCVAGSPLLWGAAFTDTPIDTAPTIVFTDTATFGTRNNHAEGRIPKGNIVPGNLAAGGPPPNFVFQGGQTEQINRALMGSVVQGNSECGPGAAVNSLHWLNDQGSINLGGDTPDQSLQKLKSDMIPSGWRGDGVTDSEFVAGKLRFAQRAEHVLNLDIHYQADSGARSDLGPSVTVGNMTATRDGNGGPPTIEYLRQQMELGQDVELLIEYLKDDNSPDGGHAVAVSGYSRAGNLNAVWFNDDAFQDGTTNGLRINQLAKIESEGNYMSLGSESRNRVVAVVAESPRTTSTFAYVLNVIANTISGFLENPLGQLIPRSGFPIPGQGGPRSGAFSAAKSSLYVDDYFGNNVTGYGVDSAGGLTLRQAIMAGTDPTSVVDVVRGGQEYVLEVNEGSNDIYEFAVSQDGTLTFLRQILLRSASFPEYMAASLDGQNFYVVSCGNMNCNGQGKVNVFTLDLNGNPTENTNSPITVGQGSVWGALDAAGTHFFTANQADGTIAELDRNINTGDLTLRGIMPVGPGVSSIVFDPRDQVAIATVGQFNAGLVFKYNEATGTLTVTSTFTTGAFPISGTFDPSGTHYYETNVQGGSVGGYTVSLADGAVFQVPGSPWPTGAGAFNSIFVSLPGSPPPQP